MGSLYKHIRLEVVDLDGTVKVYLSEIYQKGHYGRIITFDQNIISLLLPNDSQIIINTSAVKHVYVEVDIDDYTTKKQK